MYATFMQRGQEGLTAPLLYQADHYGAATTAYVTRAVHMGWAVYIYLGTAKNDDKMHT